MIKHILYVIIFVNFHDFSALTYLTSTYPNRIILQSVFMN